MKSGKFKVDDGAVKIETFNGMTNGRYDAPVRFGRPSKKSSHNPDGFSDHLPISVVVSEK